MADQDLPLVSMFPKKCESDLTLFSTGFFIYPKRRIFVCNISLSNMESFLTAMDGSSIRTMSQIRTRQISHNLKEVNMSTQIEFKDGNRPLVTDEVVKF